MTALSAAINRSHPDGNTFLYHFATRAAMYSYYSLTSYNTFVISSNVPKLIPVITHNVSWCKILLPIYTSKSPSTTIAAECFKSFWIITRTLYKNKKKAFQTNTNLPLANSMVYTLKKFEHIWGGGGPCTKRSKLNKFEHLQ